MHSIHLKIAWRNLIKDGRTTLLNLLGLSTGLACAILIFLWVNDELHVNKFHDNNDSLYQVLKNGETPNGVVTTENTPGLLAASLAKELPEVKNAVSVIPVSWSDKKAILTYGSRNIETSAQFASKDFLEIFTYPLLQGDKHSALNGKYSVILSAATAQKLFGTTENLIGKSIQCSLKDYNGEYIISGIFQSPPGNSTSQFDMVLNYELFSEKNPKLNDWRNSDPRTYIVLKEGTDAEKFAGKIKGYIKSKNPESNQTLFLQQYSDKYLHSNYENGIPSGGRIEYVKLFSLVAIFILVIACINFMNLSTARAAGRMKETGIQKVIGASRSSLVAQYMGESLLTATIASVTAVLLVLLLLPRFNDITAKQLSLPFDLYTTLFLGGITIITGLIAGSYPAIYLSGFTSYLALKGQFRNAAGALIIRKGLVVFQFTLTVILMVSVWVIYRQMQLVQTRNLGYNREHLIYFDKGEMLSENKDDYAPGGKYETALARFIEQVKQMPGVVNAANFRHNIVDRTGGTTDLTWPGKDPNTTINFTDLGTGNNFIETMGIEMKEGRSFSSQYGGDRSAIIFNEKAIEQMGIKNPVGKVVRLWGEDREIIGVAKNFNFQSLYEDITPCFFDLTVNQRASKIMVRIKAGQEKATIAHLEKLYKEENNGLAMDYRFLDEDYQALYASEIRIAALSKYFSLLAMIISCLGLFGLVAFTAQKRRKEIGIRKVAGATVSSILVLVSRDFLQLIFTSMLIAFPVSMFLMNKWLGAFAYRITIGAATYLIVGLVAVLVTLFTISLVAIKAASVNPVKSLRNE